jgi:hypothetical protein
VIFTVSQDDSSPFKGFTRVKQWLIKKREHVCPLLSKQGSPRLALSYGSGKYWRILIFIVLAWTIEATNENGFFNDSFPSSKTFEKAQLFFANRQDDRKLERLCSLLEPFRTNARNGSMLCQS